MKNLEVAAALRALAERVRRNIPHRRDPDRFHLEKSEIAFRILEITDGLAPSEISVPPQPVPSVITVGGRRVSG